LGVEGSEPTPECQRLTIRQRNELGGAEQVRRRWVPCRPWT
jgi:hypothetical protein